MTCGRPSSESAKSSFVRLLTILPCLSRTLARTLTTLTCTERVVAGCVCGADEETGGPLLPVGVDCAHVTTGQRAVPSPRTSARSSRTACEILVRPIVHSRDDYGAGWIVASLGGLFPRVRTWSGRDWLFPTARKSL